MSVDNHQRNQETADNLLRSIEDSVGATFCPVLTLPGDNLTSNLFQNPQLKESSSNSFFKIGGGLIYSQNKIFSTVAGELAYRPPSLYYVKSNTKRYFPKVSDQVVGVIEDKTAEFYLVNIYCGYSCILNRLAFEGATKRNKPELKKGDVIYARVISASKDTDTELSCISTIGSKKEWSSGETVSIMILRLSCLSCSYFF